MSETDITRLLNELESADQGFLAPLLPLVYEELRTRARGYLRGERAGHTLNTTALVHESYLKLAAREQKEWENRAHFYAVASLVMRHIVVDHARHHRADKRGAGHKPVSLDLAGPVISPERADELVALDEALDRLAEVNPRAAQVVQCKYFAGLTDQETAEALSVAPITVRRDWHLAAAWLKRRLQDGGTD